MATATEADLPWFTTGDVDGFFGLFFSGFPDLLLIVGLAPVCGFPLSFVAGRILPGAAISILAGNLFYAWQARRLAPTGRAAAMSPPSLSASIHPPSSPTCSSSWAPSLPRTHDASLAHLARRHLRQPGERHRADRRSLMHRLAAPQHAARRAPLPAGRPRAGLSLPGLRLRRLPAGSHRFAPHAGPLHPLRLPSQTAVWRAHRLSLRSLSARC